jgi:CDP-glycerol glycerophosphotransferase
MLLATGQARLARWYRRYVPLALRASLRQAAAGRLKQGRDIVSVVVPIYNVEEYLAECLDSILEQTYGALEIIIVDDGSPDGSYRIAESYAQGDPRIRVVRQANAGLGAARNTGAANAHGRYLCFVDSDDTMPPDAIARMARSLQATGSDFAIGAPRRMGTNRIWTPGWVQQVYAQRRERVTLDEFPDILKSLVAWGKLFDATFFRRVVGAFPEGVRYEDQEPASRAFVTGIFDVLPSPVYHWRVREDRTSITQQRSDPANLFDRLAVTRRVAEIVYRGANPATYGAWLAKAIGFDLRPYFEQVPRTDLAFFEQLRSGVQALASRMTPETWQLVPILDQIPALAVLTGFREDVATTVCRQHEYGWFVPTDVRPDGIYLDRSYLEGMRVQPSENQLRLAPGDLRVIARATSLWWHGTVLRLAGHAYLTNLPYEPEIASTYIDLVSSDDYRIPLSVRPQRDDRIDIESKDAWNSHSESGFVVEVDPTALSISGTGPWQVEVTVTVGDVRRTAVLCDRDTRGIASTQPVAAVREGGRWMAGFEDDGSLQIRHTTDLGAPITELRSDGRHLSMTVDDPSAQTLGIWCRSLGREIDVPGRRDYVTGRVSFDVLLPELGGNDDVEREHTWSLRTRGETEVPRPLSYQGSADDLDRDSPEHHRVRAVMTRAGTLRLAQNRWRAVADDFHVDGETFTVTGRISASGATDLSGRMVAESQAIEADQVIVDRAAETFSARFPFNTGARVPTTRQGFIVRLSVQLDGWEQERWLRTSHGLQHRLPADGDAERYGLTVTRTKKLAALSTRFRPRYLPDERGRLHQRRLHHHFRTPVASGGGASAELRDAVLFECFGGRGVGDSVLAIYEQLRDRNPGLDFFWSVSDLSIPVPDDATPLLVHSRRWMDVLHNARYLVNNANFPFYFSKRAGQTYVQTWHGTPLKRIGNDVPAANLPLSYRQLMQREARYWDVLLAQDDFAARILPKAFGYEGRVLNLGYPRNDALVDAEAPLRRKRARADLGLTDDHRVILYAPTWRDDVSVATGYALVSHLDFAAAQAAAGENTVFLLRGHSHTGHYSTAQPPGVIDVTGHADINDLLLVADVLITDYSSVMFDYAVTGKPMVFLTPDLEQYRDVTRGFYLDFEDVAPGPIYRTNDELISALAASTWTDLAQSDRYRAFVERFAPRDDGQAARRVVEAVWGPVSDLASQVGHRGPQSTHTSLAREPFGGW